MEDSCTTSQEGAELAVLPVHGVTTQSFFLFGCLPTFKMNNTDKVIWKALPCLAFSDQVTCWHMCEVVQVHWVKVSLELIGIIDPMRGVVRIRHPRALEKVCVGDREIFFLIFF